MKLRGIRFEKEDSDLWIIWNELDHTKISANEVKKLIKFLQTKKRKKKNV